MNQEKFNNETDAVAAARKLTKQQRTQHYVIHDLRQSAWYVEDEAPFIRPAFEAQVYPKAT